MEKRDRGSLASKEARMKKAMNSLYLLKRKASELVRCWKLQKDELQVQDMI
jgi:hypothetical protein